MRTVVELQRNADVELERIAPVIDDLGRLFAAAGHELALVGGPVRDAMLGRPHNDLDFATSARPDETERLLAGWGEATWDNWIAGLKGASGRKGRALFHPLRLALTGREDGPELKLLLPLIGRDKAEARLQGRAA